MKSVGRTKNSVNPDYVLSVHTDAAATDSITITFPKELGYVASDQEPSSAEPGAASKICGLVPGKALQFRSMCPDPATVSSAIVWTKTGLDVVSTAYKQKDLVSRLLSKVLREPVAITGAPGAGKTVLAEQLAGGKAPIDYQLPGQSRRVERARLPNSRIGLNVIPGQQSDHVRELEQTRYAGIVHVACYGYLTLRQTGAHTHATWAAKKAAEELGYPTVEALAANQRAAELEAFRLVADHVIRRHRTGAPLRWLAIAVNKCDLFWERIEEAREYYFTGDFGVEIQRLRQAIGEASLEVPVLPVSAYLETFRVGDLVATSRIDETQRAVLLQQMRQLLLEVD